MNYSVFDGSEIEQKLLVLAPKRRVAFAASCCERMLPNYLAFSRIAKWGDFKALRVALDRVWDALTGQPISENDHERLIEICDANIPDTEEWSVELMSAALDAGTAVLETLKCLKDGSARRATEVAGFARDTVHMFLQDRDSLDPADRDFERKIYTNTLMMDELNNQKIALDALARTDEPDLVVINALRHMAMREGEKGGSLGAVLK